MLVRLLILVILGALVYRAVKSWLGSTHYPEKDAAVHPPESVDDVMIQDPVCGIYFPRRDAVVLTRNNRDYLFCSTECRDRYAAQQAQNRSR